MAVINTNIMALSAQNKLAASQSQLGTAIERLSSGLRINSAKDDAAGMAISTRFTSNIEGLNQASRNANDGISIAQTTEAALSQLTDNLGRIRELTVQAANGSNSPKDLESIQQEIGQRLEEINRISEQTQFNGIDVLNKAGNLTIQVGANDGETITINLTGMNTTTLGLEGFNVQDMLATKELGNGSEVAVTVGLSDENFASSGALVSTSSAQKELLVDDDGNHFIRTTTTTGAGSSASTTVAINAATIGLDGVVSAGSTVSGSAIPTSPTAIAQGGNVQLTVDASGLAEEQALVQGSDGNLYIQDADGTLNVAEFASSGNAVVAGDPASVADKTVNPLAMLDSALDQVSSLRSEMGAVQSRFEAVIQALDNTSTNLAAARSRIQDADYAEEVSAMTRAQILQQAGTAVLAQANQVPQTMLALLR